MKRNKVVMLCALCIGILLTGCGDKSEPTTEHITENEVETSEVTADNNEQDSSVQNDEKNVNAGDMKEGDEDREKGYTYFMKTRFKDGITYGLGFNAPQDFEYNENESSSSKTILNKGNEQISVDRNGWYYEIYNSYKETGEWNGLWEEEIRDTQEVESIYGTILVITGYSSLIECNVDSCFLDYDGDMWLIQRKQAENTRSIEDILDEMFTPTENDRLSEESQDAMNEDTSSPVSIDMSTTDFSYYLGEIEYVPDIDSFEVERVFGFNMPEEYDERGSAASNLETEPDLITYREFYFSNRITGDYISVGMPENLYYIKKFIDDDVYNVGEEFRDLGVNMYTLDTLEKGKTVDTMYGTTQIIYQAAINSFSGNVEKSELALFNVNNHDVLIKYTYSIEDDTPVKGTLEKILPEMVAE